MWNGETKKLGSGQLRLKVIRVPVLQHRLLKCCFQPSISEVNKFEPEQPEALAIYAHWNPLAYFGTLNREGTKECSEVVQDPFPNLSRVEGPFKSPKEMANLSHPKASTLIPRIVMIPNHPKYPLIASFASYQQNLSPKRGTNLRNLTNTFVFQ